MAQREGEPMPSEGKDLHVLDEEEEADSDDSRRHHVLPRATTDPALGCRAGRTSSKTREEMNSSSSSTCGRPSGVQPRIERGVSDTTHLRSPTRTGNSSWATEVSELGQRGWKMLAALGGAVLTSHLSGSLDQSNDGQDEDSDDEDMSPRSTSMMKAQKRLDRLEKGREVGEEELEEYLKDLVWYKNRWVKGRLLHFAIAESARLEEPDAATVVRVLDARADLYGTASYQKDGKRNDLQAIHIAAGLGCIPAMKALIDRVEEPVKLINTFCLLHRVPEDGQPKEFYCPIHDAAFLGSKDATCWLLENKAEPSLPNMEGWTALHWLAKKGHDREHDLEVMIRSLVRHKARLDTRTGDHGGKIPLELAAADDSQFPKRLLHLLAPSFQSGIERTGGIGEESSPTRLTKVAATDEPARTSSALLPWSHASFLDDICLLSSLNTTAANQLARHVSEDLAAHKRVQADAQKENAVDLLANLIHMAPEAAADMLQLLAVKPAVQDMGRHPIRTRASMWGFPYLKRMRCAYHADCEKNKEGLNWPVWKFDSSKKDDKDLADQPELRWHLDLVRKPEEHEERREYVVDVDTKVVLVPNILDIDVFMALACTKYMRIFAKLPVQGIIFCLWEELMMSAFALRLLLNIMDVVVMTFWGLASQQENGERFASSGLWSLRWSVVASGLLRDVVNMAWWFGAHSAKYWGHYRSFRRFQESEDKWGLQRPPGLHALWRPQSFFTHAVLFELALHLMKGTFVWQTYGAGAGSLDPAQQALLATLTVMQISWIIYTLRLTNTGKKINTIFNACISGSIFEMLIVTFLFFFSVCLAFMMLKTKSDTSGIGLFLYRGLLFGDGDALDQMGLKIDQAIEDQHLTRTFVMILATLLFNVVLMNLTTAVYSAEYDRLEKEAELTFQQERAKCCCELLLGMQKIKLRDDDSAPCVIWGMWTLTVASAAVGLIQHFWPVFGRGGACLAGAVFFTLAQVLALGLRLQSCWFPWHGDDQEGPEQDHFLWICHRGDFSEEQYCADDLDKGAAEALVDEKVAQLSERLKGQLERMDGKMMGLNRRFDARIDSIDTKIRKMLRLQERLMKQMAGPHTEDALRLVREKMLMESQAGLVEDAAVTESVSWGSEGRPAAAGFPKLEAWRERRPSQ